VILGRKQHYRYVIDCDRGYYRTVCTFTPRGEESINPINSKRKKSQVLE
jgi:hypothetical protein